eukprot:6353650-Pyramimonas_sp.AAC.1
MTLPAQPRKRRQNCRSRAGGPPRWDAQSFGESAATEHTPKRNLQVSARCTWQDITPNTPDHRVGGCMSATSFGR